MELFFGVIVKRADAIHLEVNEDETVRIVALAYNRGDARAFPAEWNTCRVLNDHKYENVKRFVGAM